MQNTHNGKVLLRVRPRGFCAGVVRAVDIVELALEAYGSPVYVHHEIVHNTYVVEQLRRRGAIFVEAIDEVPHGAVLVFSAHGVPPTVREEAKARELKVIDATCPLVRKVHWQAARFAQQGYTIAFVGHRGHDEVVHLGIGSVARRRTREIAEVAIHIDVIFVRARAKGKAVGVKRMVEQDRNAALGDRSVDSWILEQRDLRAGTAEPLDAVRTRHQT